MYAYNNDSYYVKSIRLINRDFFKYIIFGVGQAKTSSSRNKVEEAIAVFFSGDSLMDVLPYCRRLAKPLIVPFSWQQPIAHSEIISGGRKTFN